MSSSAPNPFIAILIGLFALPVLVLRAVLAGVATLLGSRGTSAHVGHSLRCSAGHVREIRASDRYRCGCGALFQGAPWSPCPVCGEHEIAAVTCDCGLAIPLHGGRHD
jgi:hypothetical protein